MKNKHVVILNESIHDDGLELLKKQCRVFIEADLGFESGNLANADGLILRASGCLESTHLDFATNLKVVGRYGVGVDNIDTRACSVRKIPIVYTPKSNSRSVAELVVAQMMAIFRNTFAQDSAVRSGAWEIRNVAAGSELSGKSLGLIGLGNIGLEVAKIATLGLEMSCSYFDLRRNETAEKELGLIFLSLDEVLASSDVVSVHVPLLPSTRDMISFRELALMRQDAVLINMARGGLVNEKALIEFLASGSLRGAALDVFESEPLEKSNPIMNQKNILLTPHSGGLTGEASQRTSVAVVSDVLAVLSGETAINVYDRG